MSFPRYEKYKDSGVEWLGEVPEGWEVKRVRFLLFDSYEGMKIGPFGSQLTAGMLSETGFKVYGQENVISSNYNRGERFISREKFADLSAYEIRPNDILITMMGTSGRCGIVPEGSEAGIMDSHLLRMRTRSIIDNRFFQYLINDAEFVKAQIVVMGKGSIMHGLNSSIIKDLNLTIPSFPEQETIAAFLDRETGKIDALVSEQERLIELLTEKRQAVISHVVTKGLDPDALMKDSGIKRLGEVPDGWEYGPLKRFAQVIDCKHHTVTFIDDGWPIVSIRELRDDKIDLSSAKLASKEEWDFLREGRIPTAGDMIFCRNASVGALGYVENDQSFCMGQDVCLIRPDFTSKFMHYLLTSRFVKEQIEALLVGATIRRANVEEIRNLVAIAPPPEAQSAIVAFLDTETAKIDTLVSQAQQAIGLLKERRSALISAAVTGKIDVRRLESV